MNADFHSRYRGRRPNGQFAKGYSGNRGGRPTKARSTRAVLQRMLGSKVSMLIGDIPRTVTVVEGLAQRLKEQLLDGDVRQLRHWVTVADKFSVVDPVKPEPQFDLSTFTEAELDVLIPLLERAIGAHSGVTATSDQDGNGDAR